MFQEDDSRLALLEQAGLQSDDEQAWAEEAERLANETAARARLLNSEAA